jgi:hypothetical protein
VGGGPPPAPPLLLRHDYTHTPQMEARGHKRPLEDNKERSEQSPPIHTIHKHSRDGESTPEQQQLHGRNVISIASTPGLRDAIARFLFPLDVASFSSCIKHLHRLYADYLLKRRVIVHSLRVRHLFQRMLWSEAKNRNAFRFNVITHDSDIYTRVRVWFKPHDQPWKVELRHVVKRQAPPGHRLSFLWNDSTRVIQLDKAALEQRVRALAWTGCRFDVTSEACGYGAQA